MPLGGSCFRRSPCYIGHRGQSPRHLPHHSHDLHWSDEHLHRWHKLTPSVGAPAAASPNGRKVTVAQITDGTITATSTGTSDDAQYWALTDTTNSRLLAAGSLASAQMVTSGNTFTLAAFDIRIPSE